MHHVSADSMLALIKLVIESGCLYFQVLSVDYNGNRTKKFIKLLEDFMFGAP